MNKANECTCPSGDGSLRWPCPAHPAVEQAGGDERAEFERAFTVQEGIYFDDKRGEYRSMNLRAIEASDALDLNLRLQGWQARAALAHRAPEVCSECSDTGKVYDESGDGPWSCYACTGNPEVIGYANGDELDNMLDDRTAVLSPGKTSFHTVPVYRLIRAALAQPSPAQAEAERPEGPTEDELEAAGLGYPLHKEEAVKLWYSGFRSEVITVLEAWEAIGHDTGINPDKEELLDSLRYMLEKCEAHDAALARVAELERQEPVAAVSEETFSSDGTSDIITRNLPIGTKLYAAPVAQAQQLNDLDKQCRDDVARALGLRPNQERGFAWSYLLASIKSCVKASEDSAQAQHSVPELLVRAEDFVSGKEVPQAWLDVQAERRRQITAEGWTPEHDDLYCAAELPRAAAAYILNGANDEAPAIWPFSAKWWKPRDARSNYVRAGALILAEIERLDRAAHGKEVGHE
ncbi:TPA: hypothetical protein L5638_001109 [Pseudomonas aeruginosa]|nr:hypothetical protein [Pseudomonas aeruginosa]